MRPTTGQAKSDQNRPVMTKSLTQTDRLIKPVEAAALLSLSRRTLRRYEVAGKLPPIKINQRVTRYRMLDVQRLMEAAV